MKNYIEQWTLPRLLRLIIGSVIVIQGIISGIWMIVVLGGLFAVMALFNVSACATGSCMTPYQRKMPMKTNNDVRYEEVK